MTSNKYEAIFFDAGNTLLRVHPSIGYIYSDTARQYGADLPEEKIEASFRALWEKTTPLVSNDGHRLSYERERDWWRDIVRHVFEEHVRFEDFDRFFDSLYDRFAEHDTWRLYSDVPDVLETLFRRGIRMSVISNWDSRLPVLIENLGLNHYFETLVVSALVGFEKPHPAIFEIALKRTGLSAEKVAYVGDDPLLDYQAARKVGMHAYHIDRYSRFEAHEHRIRSLSELLNHV